MKLSEIIKRFDQEIEDRKRRTHVLFDMVLEVSGDIDVDENALAMARVKDLVSQSKSHIISDLTTHADLVTEGFLLVWGNEPHPELANNGHN